jgi:hypothetical protein
MKACLDGTHSKVRIGNYLSSSFPIENGLKQENALSSILFNFALEYAVRKVQEARLGLDMNGTHHVPASTPRDPGSNPGPSEDFSLKLTT